MPAGRPAKKYLPLKAKYGSVYGLKCPYTGELVYIWATKLPIERRFEAHINMSKTRPSTPIHFWIFMLEDMLPILVLIEDMIPIEKLKEREKFHIIDNMATVYNKAKNPMHSKKAMDEHDRLLYDYFA